jgi:hypothetical protein
MTVAARRQPVPFCGKATPRRHTLLGSRPSVDLRRATAATNAPKIHPGQR